MTQVLKNRKGVTLVELLAVIVIMGIIAAIAVPAIGGLISNQKLKAVEAQLVQIEEAARLYAIDNPDGPAVDAGDLTGYITFESGDNFDSITFTVSNGTVTFATLTDASVTFNGDTFTVDGGPGAWEVTAS